MSQAKILLYTNHQCPYAHRAHIALSELKIPFSEEIIDLSVPRTEAYLKVNPRGKVPAINYNGHIIAESAIIARLLTDAHPSHLVPPSNSEAGALRRAHIDFFADTYSNSITPIIFQAWSAKTDEEARALGQTLVQKVVQDIEPLLADAAPYFGGSDKVTLAEVLTASFVIRLRSLATRGVLFQDAFAELRTTAPNFTKWAKVLTETPSIVDIFDEDAWIDRVKGLLEKARA